MTLTDGTVAGDPSVTPFDGKAARRPFLDKVQPGVYKAMGGVHTALAQAAKDAGVGADLIELVNLRASQINGCAYCLSIHAPKALKAGVTQQQIDILPAWRDADLYSPEQRAALAVSEAVTRIVPDEEMEALVLDAVEFLGEEKYAVLAWAATVINAFNRISIVSRYPVRKEQA